ncbi:hypothetical protein PMAYCL1PPCAC_14688, partial [Pristionchus mayeri]
TVTSPESGDREGEGGGVSSLRQTTENVVIVIVRRRHWLAESRAQRVPAVVDARPELLHVLDALLVGAFHGLVLRVGDHAQNDDGDEGEEASDQVPFGTFQPDMGLQEGDMDLDYGKGVR